MSIFVIKAKLDHRVNCIIDSGVAEREVFNMDRIVDAAPWGVEQCQDC